MQKGDQEVKIKNEFNTPLKLEDIKEMKTSSKKEDINLGEKGSVQVRNMCSKNGDREETNQLIEGLSQVDIALIYDALFEVSETCKQKEQLTMKREVSNDQSKLQDSNLKLKQEEPQTHSMSKEILESTSKGTP